MNVLIILVVLFAALAIIIPLIERSKARVSDEQASKFARWVWPLMMVLLVVQLIMMMVRG